MKNPFLIIVHFGKTELTTDCLKSVYASGNSPNMILINNNQDKSLIGMVKVYKNLHLVNPETNLGFVGANNLGIKMALGKGADFVVLLNNDTIIPSNFLEKLSDYAYTSHKIGIVSPKIYFAPRSEERR